MNTTNFIWVLALNSFMNIEVLNWVVITVMFKTVIELNSYNETLKGKLPKRYQLIHARLFPTSRAVYRVNNFEVR